MCLPVGLGRALPVSCVLSVAPLPSASRTPRLPRGLAEGPDDTLPPLRFAGLSSPVSGRSPGKRLWLIFFTDALVRSPPTDFSAARPRAVAFFLLDDVEPLP